MAQDQGLGEAAIFVAKEYHTNLLKPSKQIALDSCVENLGEKKLVTIDSYKESAQMYCDI